MFSLIPLIPLISLMFASFVEFQEDTYTQTVKNECNVTESRIKVTSGDNISRLCNFDYISYYNNSLKIPEIVIETIEPSDFFGSAGRYSGFLMDNRIENSPNTRDYTHSGFDRGHMSAAANSKSPISTKQSNLMTNIAPQYNQLNNGYWKALENYSRSLGYTTPTKVINASIFENCESPDTISNGEIAVPSYFLKIIFNENMTKAWILPNSENIRDLEIDDYKILDSTESKYSKKLNYKLCDSRITVDLINLNK